VEIRGTFDASLVSQQGTQRFGESVASVFTRGRKVCLYVLKQGKKKGNLNCKKEKGLSGLCSQTKRLKKDLPRYGFEKKKITSLGRLRNSVIEQLGEETLDS